MRKRIVFGILVMGLSGIVAEIVLLRELLITFYGNELSIGIILANWLMLEAIGAFFLGKKADLFKKKLETFIVLTVVFSVAFPAAIYLARVVKWIMGLTAGEGMGIVSIFFSSFLILLPVSVSHGALFTFGCKIYSLYSRESDATSVGKVYIYETLGTIAGGVGLTYLLIPYLNSVKIAFLISLLNFLICLYLMAPFRKGPRSASRGALAGASGALFLLFAALFFGGGADRIHASSVKNQWKGEHVLHYQNSIYGNVAVIEREGQFTFFSNGMPVITTPVPDIAYLEEFVHFPMLFHEQPEDVLVISGGAGGLINEALKHPSVKRVDYAELDPLILEMVKKFRTPLTERELNEPRVNIEYVDGKVFVRTSPRTYDVVFVGISNPSDLQVNRLFTLEFFTLVKHKLKKGGMLVMSLPGSLTYLGRELRDLNRCVLNTLRASYPHVRIIPGDINLFLASDSSALSRTGSGEIVRRFRDRGLDTGFLTAAYIEYKLSPRWLGWFLKSIETGTRKINRDFLPIGLFYSVSHWNALFSPHTARLFGVFEKVKTYQFLYISLFLVGLFLFLGKRSGKRIGQSISLCITSTGFAGMIFDLVLIFAFQAFYGYVFHWIGLLVTALMAGTAFGGWKMTSLLDKIKKTPSVFLKIEAIIVIFSITLPAAFLVLQPYAAYKAALLLKGVFLLLSFFSGFLIGAEFPLANKMYLASGAKAEKANLGGTAGRLYGADLLGGWLGGIAGGVILLPVLGLVGTCAVVFMLKLSSLTVFAFYAKST